MRFTPFLHNNKGQTFGWPFFQIACKSVLDGLLQLLQKVVW